MISIVSLLEEGKCRGKCRVRRALKKQVGGAVSVPVPRTNQRIRENVKQRIPSGQFNLGIPVLDNEYTKAVLTSEGNIEKKVCNVSARKYPLKEVCAQRSTEIENRSRV